VLDSFDLDRGDRGTGDAGQKRPAHGVPEGVAETGLERFDDEPRPVFADFLDFDLGALNNQQLGLPHFE
jgi:hypothetical protein